VERLALEFLLTFLLIVLVVGRTLFFEYALVLVAPSVELRLNRDCGGKPHRQQLDIDELVLIFVLIFVDIARRLRRDRSRDVRRRTFRRWALRG
jgi:hypothetical protein